MNLADAEKPVFGRFQGVDLEEIGVIEHPRDPVFVPRLLQELKLVRSADGDYLQGVVLGIGGPANVQNGAVRPCAKGLDDLESADADLAHSSTIPVRDARFLCGMIAKSATF